MVERDNWNKTFVFNKSNSIKIYLSLLLLYCYFNPSFQIATYQADKTTTSTASTLTTTKVTTTKQPTTTTHPPNFFYGKSCKKIQDCHGLSHGACINDKCLCDYGYGPERPERVKSDKCVSFHELDCHDDKQCQDADNNRKCNVMNDKSYRCVCNRDYYEKTKTKKCEKQSDLGEQCSQNNQCKTSIKYAICNKQKSPNGICNCDPEHTRSGNDCDEKHCSVNNDCQSKDYKYDSHLNCHLRLCKCDDGYKMSESGVCLIGDDPTTIEPTDDPTTTYTTIEQCSQNNQCKTKYAICNKQKSPNGICTCDPEHTIRGNEKVCNEKHCSVSSDCRSKDYNYDSHLNCHNRLCKCDPGYKMSGSGVCSTSDNLTTIEPTDDPTSAKIK